MARLDLRPFIIAGRFLTRLPFPAPLSVTPAEAGRAVPWFPLIGLILGMLSAAVSALLAPLDPAMAAVLVLMVWVWATGALHLDGLADSADAWIGGLGDRERTLRIMKDPRSGPAAIVVVSLALLGKWTALTTLMRADILWPLLVVPLLARALLPLLMLTTPYARPAGMAADQVTHLPRPAAIGAVSASALAGILIGGWGGVVLCAAAVTIFALARRAIVQRIEGFTGDTAGALVEVSETLLLMIAAAMIGGTATP